MPVMRMFEEVCESCDVGVLSLFFRDSTRSVSVSLDFARSQYPLLLVCVFRLGRRRGFRVRNAASVH